MHDFLLPDESSSTATPIDIVCSARETLADLPQTAVTWRICDLDVGNAFRARINHTDWPNGGRGQRLLWFLGAWPLPPRVTSGATNGKNARYVNPHANRETRCRYADGIELCACGRPVRPPAGVRHEFDRHPATTDSECSAIEFKQAERDNWALREWIIREGYRLDVDPDTIAARLGVASQRPIGRMCQSLNLPAPAELRDDARIEIGETTLVLNRVHDVPVTKLARAFDRSQTMLRNCRKRACEAHGGEQAVLDRFTAADTDAEPYHPTDSLPGVQPRTAGAGAGGEQA